MIASITSGIGENLTKQESSRKLSPNVFKIIQLLKLLNILFGAAQSLKKEFNLDDVFVIRKPLRPGIKSEMHLTNGDGVIRMAKVSGIAEKLRQDANLFPPFFVFCFKEQNSDHKIDQMKHFFGQKLFEHYTRTLTERAIHERKINGTQA